MDFISTKITAHCKTILIIFVIFALICCYWILGLMTNNNLSDYLPQDAQSTEALDIMSSEFDTAVPNAYVMIPNLSITEGKQYKDIIKDIKGVTDVLWLDDVIDLTKPIDTADSETVKTYYRGDTALFSVSISEGYESTAINDIYELDDSISITGDAADSAYSESLGSSESIGAILILVPLILIILFVTTTSWIEPLLYFITIGVAILLNLGTTALSGEISNVTMAVAPVLQLAVSLDYAIFMLHNFQKHRHETDDAQLAMRMAIKSSFSSIAASAATTLFGFLSLMFMNFLIGPDMGIVLVKGIIFSYISVMILLPALTLCCYKYIDKTSHKRIVPSLDRFASILTKIRVPVLILVLIVVIPCYLAQSNTNFFYGTGDPDSSTRYGADTLAINEEFGQMNYLVVLVPRGEPSKEQILCQEFDKLNNITSISSYVSSVSGVIPPDFLSKGIQENFYSDNYARIIMTCDTGQESQEAFNLVERVRDITSEYYSEYYTCGQSANLYDMKNVVNRDNKVVTSIAIIAIAIILFITFRSLLLPIVLLLVIESAIWINLSFSYFAGGTLSYIGYLVINTVQLGATIDYAILFSENYLRERRLHGPTVAAGRAITNKILSIIVSVFTLSGAGFCLYLTSSNVIVQALGLLLGRGTLISFLLVACMLPALLIILDKPIERLTYKSQFHEGGSSHAKTQNT